MATTQSKVFRLTDDAGMTFEVKLNNLQTSYNLQAEVTLIGNVDSENPGSETERRYPAAAINIALSQGADFYSNDDVAAALKGDKILTAALPVAIQELTDKYIRPQE